MKEKSALIRISKGKQITMQPLQEDINQLFKNAKKIKPKYKLTTKQMDELIEREIIK